MAQKLDADLNIIQRSNIEVQIDPITADLNIIQALDDEPNDVGGLSAAELKAKFDEAGNIIKTFINDSLIPQVTAETVSEEQRELNEQQRQDNEAQRQANEQVRQANEEERKAAEAARAVWEDYDPGRAYVPGNKVYWAGSSYVNKAPCTGVPPNVAANWQMVAKRGETVGGGMTEEDCDERYLQLSGGTMTGPLTVQEPTQPDHPATLTFLQPVSLSVTRLPDKKLYSLGEAFDPSGMEVEASYANGQTARVTGYLCDQTTVESDTDKITIRYTEARKEQVAEIPVGTGMPEEAVKSHLPVSKVWRPPVYANGIWGAVAYKENDQSHGNTNAAVYSEDGGKTWTSVTLPVKQHWEAPVYQDGSWILLFEYSASLKYYQVAYSTDFKTWAVSSLPDSSLIWRTPVYGNGIWVTAGSSSAGVTKIFYSEDGCRTWTLAKTISPAYSVSVFFVNEKWFVFPEGNRTELFYSSDGKSWAKTNIPAPAQAWNTPVYADGMWVVSPIAGDKALYSENGEIWYGSNSLTSRNFFPPVYGDGVWVLIQNGGQLSTIFYSEDGGKNWASASLPATQYWDTPAYENGIWVIGPYGGTASVAAYSEDNGKTWNSAPLPSALGCYITGFDSQSGLLFAMGTMGGAYSEDGKLWTSMGLGMDIGTGSPVWTIPVYGDGVFITFFTTFVTDHIFNNSAFAYMDTFKKLEGETGRPQVSLEARLAALEAENSALAAAIERGLSL